MKQITIKNFHSYEVQKHREGDGKDILVWGLNDMEVSDGYHTIGELYDHRITLYIALCKQITHQPYCDDKKFGVWRSQRHFDGSNYDGWFILGIGREKGKQITYHIPNELWEETNFAETFEKAPMEWDGHTSEDVLERISKL